MFHCCSCPFLYSDLSQASSFLMVMYKSCYSICLACAHSREYWLSRTLFSAFSSSAIKLSCRLPSTNARNERIRASKIPIMARMYAQRTEQAPRVYLSVFSPHIRFTSSESQPSGKIIQPSTRQAAEVSCIQAQILYTVAVLQKKKRVKQTMQAMMSIIERPMKKEAALKAPEGSVEKSVKLPLQVSSREKPLPMQ